MTQCSPTETRQTVTILNREAYEALRNRPPPIITPSKPTQFRPRKLSQKHIKISLLVFQIVIAVTLQVLAFFAVITSSGSVFRPGKFSDGEAAETTFFFINLLLPLTISIELYALGNNLFSIKQYTITQGVKSAYLIILNSHFFGWRHPTDFWNTVVFYVIQLAISSSFVGAFGYGVVLWRREMKEDKKEEREPLLLKC